MEKYKTNDTYSYCLGSSLVIEALLHIPEYLEKVYLSPKYNLNENYTLLDNLCEKHKIEKIFDQKQIDKLSLKENCYAVGVFKKYYRKLETNKHILLYNFDNYGDLGTLMRSAVSFDFKDLVLIGNDIDYFEPLCVRSSMGSIFHLNIFSYKTIDEYLKDYPNQKIIPFISKGKDINDIKIINKYSLLIPHKLYELDSIYKDGFSIIDKEISLSSLSSIIFNYFYNINIEK